MVGLWSIHECMFLSSIIVAGGPVASASLFVWWYPSFERGMMFESDEKSFDEFC